MRLILKTFFLFTVVNVFSQTTNPVLPTVKIDSLYREDQFYFGFTLNTLQNKPVGLTQDKFSSGFSTGFLRDFPINKERTVAIAPGLGFSYNSYNQNLKIEKANQITTYTIIDQDTSFKTNRFSQFLVELPIEFRWRSSTFESHKFWRIYGGFKMSYLLYDKSVYEDELSKIVVTNNKDFNKFLYGAYLSAGYNSINVYAYYGLNTFFQLARTNTASIDMNSFSVGILFYIL